MAPNSALNSTLEELEGERWGEPTHPSHLVNEGHRLRTVPLRLLTIENLRIMLGQDIGSRYLVPIALDLRDRVAAVAARAIAAVAASGQEYGPVVAKALRKAHGVFTG